LSYRRSAPAYRRSPALLKSRTGVPIQKKERSGRGADRPARSVDSGSVRGLGPDEELRSLFGRLRIEDGVVQRRGELLRHDDAHTSRLGLGIGGRGLVDRLERDPALTVRGLLGHEPDRLSLDLVLSEDVPERRRGRIRDLEHGVPPSVSRSGFLPARAGFEHAV